MESNAISTIENSEAGLHMSTDSRFWRSSYLIEAQNGRIDIIHHIIESLQKRNRESGLDSSEKISELVREAIL